MTFMEVIQNVLPELTSECKNGDELYGVLRMNNTGSGNSGECSRGLGWGCPASFFSDIPYKSYCSMVSCGKCYEKEILPEDFEKLYLQNTRNNLIPDHVTNIPLAKLFGRSSSSISDDDLEALLQGGE